MSRCPKHRQAVFWTSRIERCRGRRHSVDKAKYIRGNAKAPEEYARQANDHRLERKVQEIRVGVERRACELLRETKKSEGGRPSENPSSDTRGLPKPKTLAEHGIAYDQSALWQKLAAVPDDEFEAEVANPVAMPTAATIVVAHDARKTEPATEPEIPAYPRALSLWGHLKDSGREGLPGQDLNHICDKMPEHMGSTDRELAPIVACQAVPLPSSSCPLLAFQDAASGDNRR
jgi:hypothetical protein